MIGNLQQQPNQEISYLAVSRLQLITRWLESKASHVTYRSFQTVPIPAGIPIVAETGLSHNCWGGNGL